MAVIDRSTCLDRAALIDRYRDNRCRSARLFDLVRDSFYEQPLELRHPFIFYLGHIPAFSYNTLAHAALGYPALHEYFDDLFRRGIDPGSVEDARGSSRQWPSVDEVRMYRERIDASIEHILAHDRLVDHGNPLLRGAQAVYTILEHEEMHQETFLYIVNRLDDSLKHTAGIAPAASPPSEKKAKRRIVVPAGSVTIGAHRDRIVFGWDNEFDATVQRVGDFFIDSLPVTNGEYLAFVQDGAAAPAAWIFDDGMWKQRSTFGLVDLQLAWPVYVSRNEATAYAAAHGARLMTEPEYHRAAFGTPEGDERFMPWGNEAPTALHGNFGFRRYDPEPVGASPLGASAWGIEELVGNGWEWTSTPFAQLPGFAPMASYPQYSADFFDGAHSILKGASPVTSTRLLRPSLRNWFRDDYRYAYTKFRLVYH